MSLGGKSVRCVETGYRIQKLLRARPHFNRILFAFSISLLSYNRHLFSIVILEFQNSSPLGLPCHVLFQDLPIYLFLVNWEKLPSWISHSPVQVRNIPGPPFESLELTSCDKRRLRRQPETTLR